MMKAFETALSVIKNAKGSDEAFSEVCQRKLDNYPYKISDAPSTLVTEYRSLARLHIVKNCSLQEACDAIIADNPKMEGEYWFEHLFPGCYLMFEREHEDDIKSVETIFYHSQTS